MSTHISEVSDIVAAVGDPLLTFVIAYGVIGGPLVIAKEGKLDGKNKEQVAGLPFVGYKSFFLNFLLLIISYFSC